MGEVLVGHGRLIAKTEKAVLINLEDWGEQWIPESQLSPSSEIWCECPVGDEGRVWVSEWFAEQRGWA